MPGPPPKNSKTRQRRNRKPGASQISGDNAPKRQPKLRAPDTRAFHKLTREWWKDVWTSPMAGEYLPTDIHGLLRIAVLVDDFNKAFDPKLRKELSVEIRLQEARFGLSPTDRSRLQWEVQKGEEAERKRKTKAASQPPARNDPRKALSLVK